LLFKEQEGNPNMSNRSTVMLTGNDLTIEDIIAIGIGDKQVGIDPAALERCRASRKFLEEEVAARRIIYGVNTSFGPMCNKIIEDGGSRPCRST
jgi:histidine ammonia-lyase